MSEDAKTKFVDGLRVTPRHLNHLAVTLEQAIQELRRTLGTGAIAYGLRLQLNGTAVTLSPGLAFAPGALRLAVASETTLTVPATGSAFSVVLELVNADESALRVADQPTVITAETSIRVVAGAVDPLPERLVIGSIARAGDGTLSVTQPAELFLAGGRHGHSGTFAQDGEGIWRYDGVAITGGPGSVGPKGDPGEQGPPGEKGDPGDPGADGAAGAAGAIGPQGLVGPAGPAGTPGLPGAPGADGAPGPEGPAGPPGPPGADGARGERGEAGAAGERGDRGPRGETGERGAQGERGATGANGEPGPKGDRGDQGPAGAQGERGATGATGEPGPKGDKGDRGERGPAGERGEIGPAGAPGPKGDKGDKGDRGDTGARGATGATGATGPGLRPELAVIDHLNWDPRREVALDQLLSLLNEGLRFTFSRSLDESFSGAFARVLVLVTFRSSALARPMRALSGTASIKGTDVIWNATDSAAVLRRELSQEPGLLSIDLDAGYVLDADRRPVSSSTARFLGLSEPFPLPGGLFRTALIKP